MKISPQGVALIKDFEGYLKPLPDGGCEAYQEPGDIPTIGWGCTKGVTLGMHWTLAEAEAALARELSIHETRVRESVSVPLSQGQFDALVSFDFNTGGLKKSTLLKLLNAADYAGAAAQFARWNKMGGKELKGLTARRAREAALFAGDSRSMPQTIDPPKTYTATDIKESSTKWSVITWLQRWLMVGNGGQLTYNLAGFDVESISTTAKTTKDAGIRNVLLAVAVCVAVAAITLTLEWLKSRMIGDANAGNYTPSGETKAKEASP